MTFAIAIGGALGSVARHYLSTAIYNVTGSAFPWGIFTVNIVGGLLMGVIVELGALKVSTGPEMRAFLTVGILGGFTTFSTFSLDTVLLIERGNYAAAAAYAIASVVASVAALFAGLYLVRGLA